MAIGTAAAIIGGGAILGSSILGAKAAGDAADAQAAASDRAVQEQQRQFDLTREDLAPYRKIGSNALTQLGGLAGVPGYDPVDFTASPGYDFRVSEGQKAIERSAASRGLLRSGATLKALDKYGQGIASDEYTNQFNRLASLAGIGQTATNTGAAAGAQAANGIGNALLAGGAARASGYINQANAITGGVNNLLTLGGLYSLYGRGGGAGNTGLGTLVG